MSAPKGGRGIKAPYETKLARIPVPLASQVSDLVDRYQDFIATGGDAQNPPLLLASDKPVDKYELEVEQLRQQLAETQAQLKELQVQKDVNKFEADSLLGMRDKFLASLKLGKQAPEYKRTKSAVDRFLEFLIKGN